jgi:YhcH/YjgK/YiaL family protein
MHIGRIGNSAGRADLDAGIRSGIEFIETSLAAGIPEDRSELSIPGAYAIVSTYETAPVRPFETHARHIDIHAVLAGEEEILHADRNVLRPLGEYNAESDSQFWAGTGEIIRMGVGTYAVFWPQDAHAAGISADDRWGET